MNKSIKILMLDDHSLFLKGLQSILNDSFSNIEYFTFNTIKNLKSYHLDYSSFDLFISDLELPGEDIFSFLKEFRSKTQKPILIVSMHQKNSLLYKCQQIGINGYISKNDNELLIEAVNRLLNDEFYFAPKIAKILNSHISQKKMLSEREEEVIRYISQGHMNRYIAEALGITIETVKSHKKNLKMKLGLSETHEIITFAKENYLL